MDELRKAKLHLPPPGQPNEFPQKPFGVFVEPNFEAKVKSLYFLTKFLWFYDNFCLCKVGMRKPIFTDTEKEVTDKVILSREQTVRELADVHPDSHGSNGQLNASGKLKLVFILMRTHVKQHIWFKGFVPESEDGGSLLGSSRKSLADTSVTSTADLSVFSTGQRSHQTFDICVDDARSVRTDDDGEEGEADNGEISPG